MIRILGLLVLLAAPLAAQDASPAPAPGPGTEAEARLLVKVVPRVLEADKSVAWEETLTQETTPGRAVTVTIDAEPLTIRFKITPFARGQDFLLVVQGDVRQEADGVVRRSATVQSLVVPAGKAVAFFPLGREPSENGRLMVVYMTVDPVHD